MVALEIGAFVGISTFCLASHLKVLKVVSVDPNPVIAQELVANSDKWVGKVNFEPLKDLRVFDITRTVLGEFDEERGKIELREGVVGSTQVSAKGKSISTLRRVDVPVVDPTEGEALVALVDGLHTKEGVRADLAAIFENNPHAVALLDDCRRGWGHLVQAGVVAFMEEAAEPYHFRLFADFAPGLAKSSFGIVYPESITAEIDGVLDKIRETFRQWSDSAHPLSHEEKPNRELKRTRKNAARFESRAANLQKQLSEVRERNARLRERVSRLEKHRDQLRQHSDQLNARYSSRRYRIVDIVATTASKILGLRSLLRRP